MKTKTLKAVGEIVILNTLPPQIDYVRPYIYKAEKAQLYINSLPKNEQDIANKVIEKQISEYYDSGAAYYDSLL